MRKGDKVGRLSLQVSADLLSELHAPVLYPTAPLPEPPRPAGTSGGSWGELAAEVAVGLGRDGMCLVRLAEPLAMSDFIALGHALGEPLPENDPAIASYVEESVVLSLRDNVRSEDDRLAPFTSKALTLHTEGSRRLVQQQPRFIVLMCLDPGAAGDGAQTILVPVAEIVGQLSDDTLAVLAATRETVVPGTPEIVRHEDGRVRLSFRDLGLETYELESAYDENAVRAALEALVRACYSSRPVFGTRWRRGDLVVIDNRRWMHGRTSAEPQAGPARHLKRLRIVAR